MNRKKLFTLLAVLMITSVACSFGFVNSIVDRLPDEIGDLMENPGQIATKMVEEVEGLSNQESDSLVFTEPDFNDLGFGLNKLDSFRTQLIQSLNGMDENGNTTNITVRNFQEVIKPLNIVHMKMEMETDVKPIQTFEVYRYENEVYLFESEETTKNDAECTPFTENVDALNLDGNDLGLSLLFSDLEVGDILEKNIIVNGIRVDHYRVNNVAMVNSTLSNVKAEIWYARNGAYIVRFNGEANGEAYSEEEDVNVSGTIRWQFDLTDVNTVTDIPLPVSCKLASEGGVNDVPLPENVQEISKIGSMLNFSSPDDASSLADYYRNEMVAAGYSLNDETIFDDFYVLTYLRAEETVTIIITGMDGGGSAAIITVEVK
ncbi:MAG: hypothetical protein Q7U53_08490 [Anaerolineaceae bacterium]|nr:hypothetical protein [Anaerolineaceae bacterium]